MWGKGAADSGGEPGGAEGWKGEPSPRRWRRGTGILSRKGLSHRSNPSREVGDRDRALRTQGHGVLVRLPSRQLSHGSPDHLPNPRTLQKLSVPIIDTPKCNLLYSKDTESGFQPKTIKADMLCAGFAEGKKDACKVGAGWCRVARG